MTRLNSALNRNFEIGETRHFKMWCADWHRVALVYEWLPPTEVCLGSRDLFKFWEISDDILETVQDRDIVAREV